MANPCRLNAQQHLFIFGLGIWVLPRFQRLSPFDDLHRKHDRILRLAALLPRHMRSRRDEMKAYHIDRFGSVGGIVRRSSEDPRPGLKEVLMRLRELAQLPRFDGPQRRWSRTDEDRRSAVVRRRRRG